MLDNVRAENISGGDSITGVDWREDAAEESNISAELIAQRKRLIDEWNAWRQRCKEELAEDRKGRGKKDVEKAEAKEEIEVWIDEVIEQIEEVVVE